MRGEEIRVEVALAGVQRTSNKQTPGRYVVALLHDVSDRRRAEQHSREVAEVESARHDAEQMVRRHASVVQQGVGEIRRELRRLQRSTQRLRRQAVRPGLSARVVEARTERLGRELDRLAIRAAIESGMLELRLERVNLVPLIGQVVARIRSRGTAHKVNAALPQGLTALVDPGLVEHVVKALIDRALARCPRGCWIDVDLRRPLVGVARIEIREFGQSVSASTRHRLLEETDADPDLALVRKIVDLLGGTFSIEFPADGGVLAIVTLPTQRGRVLAAGKLVSHRADNL